MPIPLPSNYHMLKRAFWHDYHCRGTYLITLVTNGRYPYLGQLRTGVYGAMIALSSFGQSIASEEIPKISQYYPQVIVYDFVIMPDHIHLIIRLTDDLPRGKTIGTIIRGFKQGCTKRWRIYSGRPDALSFFADGYNDRILMEEGQLDRWKQYLHDNPRRLAMKHLHPDLFTVMHSQSVAGISCQMIGNHFLLNIPDIRAVIIHRRYSEEQRQLLASQWLAAGEAGAVLVSAAIADEERAVMREAFARQCRIIKLRQQGFRPLYKPVGRSFDACAEGRLLEVSPWPASTREETITRQQCLQLNAIAEALQEGRALEGEQWLSIGRSPMVAT